MARLPHFAPLQGDEEPLGVRRARIPGLMEANPRHRNRPGASGLDPSDGSDVRASRTASVVPRSGRSAAWFSGGGLRGTDGASAPKSGGPPLFELSLKVERNDTHNQKSRFAVLPRCMASTLRVPESSASGGQAVAKMAARRKPTSAKSLNRFGDSWLSLYPVLALARMSDHHQGDSLRQNAEWKGCGGVSWLRS